VVLEMHETSDVGEASIPLASTYTSTMMKQLSRYVDGIVVHSESDAALVVKAYPCLAEAPYAVIHPGPLEHGEGAVTLTSRDRQPDEPIRLLFFGVIRPYKGIDELAAAYRSLIDDGYNLHLTVAGEPWDDSERALAMIAATGPGRHEIKAGYVADEAVHSLFEASDIVVLPYRRASASGPIHLTMGNGLPLVTTRVPALEEACQEYEGAELADPEDVQSLRDAILRAIERVGERYPNPHTWDANALRYRALFDRLAGAPQGALADRAAV
jgi:glycosyltransferase involved in cell wall biosynthesis